LEKIVEETGLKDIQAILFDLGWSTSQLEDKKGFSFQNKEKLDMRYGDKGKTASELVNNLPKDELDFIFRRYGEEKFSNKIAREIVDKREDSPIETTNQLVDIILKVYRNKLNSDKEVPWTGGTHPATQVFQALRIAVNKELKSLKQALPQAVEVLDNLGRIAVISFHSLEDRIVKHFFKDNEDRLEIITKSPITPAESELEQNPKARSAKLRVAEKI
ncbi:MAG: 16S rRNA (cytosine(1402)-N(4))-methyltransferase, partial [Parcubacteria group bacterium QH_9_35_7]